MSNTVAMQTGSLSDVLFATMAPIWLEVCFIFFFALGFVFLRAEKFRQLLSNKPPPQKKVTSSNVQNKGAESKLKKTIDAEAAAENWNGVLKAWRYSRDSLPTPTEQLRTVVQAFLETDPEALVEEVTTHMQYHKASLVNTRTAIAVLDLVARKSEVKMMAELCDIFKTELRLKCSLPMYEVLLGGFATVGDHAKVDELLKQVRADHLKLSARGYSLLIKGFLKNGMVDAVFPHIVAMEKSGFAVPSFAVTQFFRVAAEAGQMEQTFTLALAEGLEMPSEAIAAVLENCVKTCNTELADKVRKQAMGAGIALSGSAYDSLLKLYAATGDRAGLDLFKEMLKGNHHLSEGLCVGILARCADSKFLLLADEVVRHRRATDGMTIALYSSLMKVYAYSGMYSAACDLYPQMLADGLEPDTMMYGCLMKFSVECGRTQLSQEISEKLPALDIQNYMSLIRMAGRDKDVEKAFDVIKKLKESQVQIDVAAFNCVMDVCVQAKDMRRARDLMDEMKATGLLDVITFNTLLKGHCSSGDLSGAKALLKEMTSQGLEPNDVSYNCIINAAVSTGKLAEAWSLIDMMEEKGIKIDNYTISIMMKTLKTTKGNFRDVARTLDLLDRSGIEVCSDEILFNTVLETCTRQKEFKRVDGYIKQYEKSQLRPSVPIYGTLIKSMSCLKRVDRCWHYWMEMVEKRGLKPTDIALGCMLDALVCNDKVDDAVELFNEWKVKLTPNTVLYSILVKGFANSSQSDRAMEACREMRQTGMKMNIVVYNSMIDAQARCGKMEQVGDLIGFMQEDGIQPDTITHSTIVKGYCVKGDLDRAYDVLKEMQSRQMIRDAVVYNTLLDGCTRHGRVDLAEVVLENMEKNNIAPSNFTLGILIKMHGRKKQLVKAFEAFESLPKRGGFQPNAQVLASLMTACLNNNAVDHALHVFKELKQMNNGVVDSRTYTALVSGLTRAGDLQQAVDVVYEAYSSQQQKLTGKMFEIDCLQRLLSALKQNGKMQQLEALQSHLTAYGVSVSQESSRVTATGSQRRH
eukprot:TRINITY_DN1957_c1_g1_i1.p1 TRINITY_DN1957_c1_g1~~TRINITY_DN1957_c1_g1_i1.p1  ORF type:complete len:1032 (-),score=250.13 TRINITY_DN1957_c1_g1_i1:180-3275(-)